MIKRVETTQEYLARGMKITVLPRCTGVGKSGTIKPQGFPILILDVCGPTYQGGYHVLRRKGV